MSARPTLVVAPNWVGDLVMALPALEALAASGRELHLLARPHLGPLLGLLPAVTGSVERAGSDAETVRRLRRLELTEAIVLPNSFRSAWLPFRARIPRRWGYAGQLRSFLLRPAVPRRRRRGHQTEDYRELLTALEVAPPADWVPRLALPPPSRSEGEALLLRAGIEPGQRPLVGLFAGAAFGPSKRWPVASFIDLANRLRRWRPAARLVLVAGPSEVLLAVEIHEKTGRIHPVVGPDLDLARLASVLSHLDLLVTNDSGPMHLAAALGVPCVALFGPTDPRRTRPAGPRHRVLYTDRWCSPCFRRRCPLLHHRCLRDIDPASALEAAQEVLGDASGA